MVAGLGHDELVGDGVGGDGDSGVFGPTCWSVSLPQLRNSFARVDSMKDARIWKPTGPRRQYRWDHRWDHRRDHRRYDWNYYLEQ